MKSALLLTCCCLILLAGLPLASAQEPDSPPLSAQTRQCLTCHRQYTPGIVSDWQSSRHASTTPQTALARPDSSRRISADTVPDHLRSVTVGCFECHGLNTKNHQDAFDHFGLRIQIVVSPEDCRACHPEEVDQYASSKKAYAIHNLEDNPVYHALVNTIDGVKKFQNGSLSALPASEPTKSDTCFACHGTRVTVNGTRALQTPLGEIEVPNLTNWPNQGVGRINPDNSRGSCTPCHARHGFSIEVARKPYTCSQCHLDPDVPAWPVYRESKHGNIMQSSHGQWNWTNVPWSPGRDFRTPTCAACHNAELAKPDGTIIAERTHDFGARLWVRLFGLPYSHPQPKSGQTYLIKNPDGLPLPTTFDGRLASGYLIDPAEQSRRRQVMTAVCQSCHSTSWADNHFAKLDHALAETDQMTLTATQLLQNAWEAGLADPANPFDEYIEQQWVLQWLFYANSVRYASAMGGPDYAAFKNGWWDLTHNLQIMREYIDQKSPPAPQ